MNDRLTMQYVYDFDALTAVPAGPTSLKVTARRLLSGPDIRTGKSSTVGAVLTGQHIICTLGRQARGTGAKAHTHPNEQFNYILQGMMMSDIEGDRVFAAPGSILHTPGMVVHTGLACPDEDLVFLAVKDTRHGIVGPPIDGKYDGPNCFPGYGGRSDETPITTAQAVEQSRALPPGPGRRYVHAMSDYAEPRAALTSAAMRQSPDLALPAGVRGRLLTGEKLHIGVLELARGSTLPRHRHANEQFTFVIRGRLEADIDGRRVTVDERCLLHVPPDTAHALHAPAGALVLVAQDNRSEYAA